MTLEEFESKVESSLTHAIKYADKEGKRMRRQSAYDVAKVQAASALKYFNYTIDWDQNNDPMGYGTVYEYIAGEYFGAGKKPMEKAEAVAENAQTMKIGFRSLQAALLDQHNLLLYMVPRISTSLKIEVITINPDYTVDENSGSTADDISTERDSRQAQGQVRSAYTRQAKVHGEKEAKERMGQAFKKAIGAPVPSPTGAKD